MTVVVYRAGVMAADSQATSHGGLITGVMQKIWRRADGALAGSSGVAGDMISFAAWFMMAFAGDWEAKDKDSGFSGLVVSAEGDVVFYDMEGRSYPLEAPFYARGVGAELATGAMAMGATAEQAVEIACRYSIYCGLPIQVERVKRCCADHRRGGEP